VTAIDVLARTLPSLAVIVGALLLLRHWAQRGQRTTDASVRVITRTGIAKGAVVAVVAVGERRMLVGASEHGVNLLTELDAAPGVELAETMDPAPAPDLLRGRLRPARSSMLHPSSDRPRMAPIDRLRSLTVRRAVPSHPRSNGVQPPT
jgi:flagellar biogenesis protein FliO